MSSMIKIDHFAYHESGEEIKYKIVMVNYGDSIKHIKEVYDYYSKPLCPLFAT
jgi:hypothetical protein